MTCLHRIVREVRVYPDSPDEQPLSASVGIAIAKATRAPVALHRAGGYRIGWVLRGAWCHLCDDEADA